MLNQCNAIHHQCMFTLSMCILQSLSVRHFIMLPNIRQGWDCGLKTLKPIFVKLKHLFLASLSSLVPCLWARTRSYYIPEYLKGVPFGKALAILTNNGLGLKGLKGAKTLVYYKNWWITEEIYFFTLHPVVDFINILHP